MDDIEHDKRLRMHLEILMKENKLDTLKKFNVIGFYVMGIGVQFFFFFELQWGREVSPIGSLEINQVKESCWKIWIV